MTSPARQDDYFSIFGMTPRLSIDAEALRISFLELSRKYHPDFFANASDEEKRTSLQLSSEVNNAYKTLRDDQKRAEYMIGKFGSGIESNKNAVPPELLEEMFEIQECGEALREARLGVDGMNLRAVEEKIAPLRTQVQATRKSLTEKLEQQFTQFDAAGLQSDNAQKLLREIRLTLDRMNYLRTVLRNLK
ncbi:Fe-S protein assembly co-chaperone HscB [Candidatus Sumerlaeota bacterium]|nr:Fe-S protein assembly co-chaperone HscB [Candidatus Sumerlaeota bacterium]